MMAAFHNLTNSLIARPDVAASPCLADKVGHLLVPSRSAGGGRLWRWTALERAAMSGFRNFLMRGNIIDLAVAVVMGVAFNAIIQALVKYMITPLIGAIIGNRKLFTSLYFPIH